MNQASVSVYKVDQNKKRKEACYSLFKKKHIPETTSQSNMMEHLHGFLIVAIACRIVKNQKKRGCFTIKFDAKAWSTTDMIVAVEGNQ